MELVRTDSALWNYLPEEIKGLLTDGELLLDLVQKHNDKDGISDYSFMVFPFAKAYEGFLKKFLLDSKLIQPEDYYSDDIRIGRILNPKYEKETVNVFRRICAHPKVGANVPRILWDAWKSGRNLVFHYFPHNFRRLSYQEANDLIKEIVHAMETAINLCEL
jgi:hypothetical protein